ncbi:hypothetical protein JCGZ_22687 [Jatropha curcas]|uniref:Uncharacterized protein n=1 Tax=Jatropha curcas TaxID=180498 RepID=A0A067JQF2_JATCU|nr:hypothetical protein JCGZ_22687 [Jatropha curcas]
MAAGNIVDWLPSDAVVDPVNRPISHTMKLREFVPDEGTTISLRHDFPNYQSRRARGARNPATTPFCLVNGLIDCLGGYRSASGRQALAILWTLFPGYRGGPCCLTYWC